MMMGRFTASIKKEKVSDFRAVFCFPWFVWAEANALLWLPEIHGRLGKLTLLSVVFFFIVSSLIWSFCIYLSL